MIVTRRAFLQTALAAIAAAPVLALAPPAPATRFDYPQVPLPSRYTTRDGAVWQYAEADRDVVGGDLVLRPNGMPLGVALVPIARGRYGWVQVHGGTAVRVRARR